MRERPVGRALARMSRSTIAKKIVVRAEIDNVDLMKLLDGRKTYLAAIGLAGLAAYQFSIGDVPSGLQSLMAALSATGLRHAIAKQAA